MSNDLAYAQLYDSCPLPNVSRFIRLLHVHAPDNDDDSHIRAHLETADLGDRPSYAALSYVWGLSSSFKIQCGAVNVPVTANCHSALWHLRKKLGAFCIWVDAICINQQDILEKEQQIARMRNIFAMSNVVYIWTGVATDATTRAMSYLASAGLNQYREIVNHITQERMGKLNLWRAFWGYHRGRWSSTRTLVPEPNNTSEYKWSWKISPLRNWRIIRGKVIVSNDDLEQLLSCAWTTRLWTYQEVIFAVNPVIVNGTFHIPWPTFVSSCVLLSDITTLPSMGRWSEIIQSRAQMRDSFAEGPLQDLRLEVKIIHDFLDMCAFVTSVTQLMTWVVLLSCLVILVVSAYLDPSFSRLELYAVIILVMVIVLVPAMYMYWLPPNPAGAWYMPRFNDDDYPFSTGFGQQEEQRRQFYQPFYTLDSPLRQGLLNTLCWRTPSEPKDEVFAILPMIQLAFDWQPFEVDYSVSRADLYTDLARIFMQEAGQSNGDDDVGILALAAKAKCPGAATWVPDFSQMLHPTLGRGYAPPTSRRADPAYTTIHDAAGDYRIYSEPYCWTLSRCFTICAVSDFVDPRRIPDHPGYLQELGEIHNLKCMMFRRSARHCRGLPFSDGTRPSGLSHDILWPQIFQRQFPLAAARFTYGDFEQYNSVFLEAIRARLEPSKLLHNLKTSHRLLDLHHSICHSFATAQELFYVSTTFVGFPKGIPFPLTSTYQHVGAVSGSQQGQIQVGDEIIGVGIQDHIAYRRAEKQLIARLDPEDSFFILQGWQELEVHHDRVKVHLA